eukprot:TRINITY_DN6508_c0_g1_i2.p1 TRINITY_DN6508_c0_g1~~TRINITY_DN6508_c0_g1_i2.p1  ORF type:complete len:199 (-),score=27.67 TRINITY_DN6508_c0_g1_i2:268-816(-)
MSSYTFLIRHIPCKIVAADFEMAMNSLGLDSSRYAVSMPSQEQRSGAAYRPGNFGYGFVSCQQQADAEAFVAAFQGYQFENVSSSKRLFIEPSTSRRTRAARRTPAVPESHASFPAGRAHASASTVDESRNHHERHLCDYTSANGSIDAGLSRARSSNFNLRLSAPPAGSEVPLTRLCHVFQ